MAAAVQAPSPGPQSEGAFRSPSPEGRGWLGVRLQNIDASIAARLGLAAPRGVLVAEITTPGPAAESDLRVGDAIVSVNGRAIADGRDLAQQIASFSSDTRVKLSILRSGNEITVFVKLGKLPSDGLAKTEQLSGNTRFNGEWRVLYTFNEQCAAAFRQNVGHWTITDGVVIGRLRGDRGTVASDGEIRIKLRGERIFAVRAQLNGSQGRGNFWIEGRRCGGSVTVQRM
jgi:membrane-associated protease RseP (regulator of RpoE activity)